MMNVEVSINYWALLACLISSVVIGTAWYGPLFGKVWARLMGFDMSDPQKVAEIKKGSTPGYVVSMVSALVMAFITSHFVDYLDVTTVSSATMSASWLWLGYTATVMAVQNAWGKKNVTLFVIDALYQWVNVVVMALIVGVWIV